MQALLFPVQCKEKIIPGMMLSLTCMVKWLKHLAGVHAVVIRSVTCDACIIALHAELHMQLYYNMGYVVVESQIVRGLCWLHDCGASIYL